MENGKWNIREGPRVLQDKTWYRDVVMRTKQNATDTITVHVASDGLVPAEATVKVAAGDGR